MAEVASIVGTLRSKGTWCKTEVYMVVVSSEAFLGLMTSIRAPRRQWQLFGTWLVPNQFKEELGFWTRVELWVESPPIPKPVHTVIITRWFGSRKRQGKTSKVKRCACYRTVQVGVITDDRVCLDLFCGSAVPTHKTSIWWSGEWERNYGLYQQVAMFQTCEVKDQIF